MEIIKTCLGLTLRLCQKAVKTGMIRDGDRGDTIMFVIHVQLSSLILAEL